MKKFCWMALTVSDNKYISQLKDIECFKKIFQPDKNHANYHIVCEEHSTGKTTLVKIVANKIGKGVIYINIPENFNKLGNAFGKVLNLTFEEDERAMNVIEHTSKIYKSNNKGRSPVIIYDNANQLINQNPEILYLLAVKEAFLKECNVSVKIDNLSEKELLDYLTNKREIKTVKEDKIDITEVK
ncbi:P-loop containing nucleoside triphosphate hydrolase protein [Rhizophagus clarus]|uniref:P-loop containing nucleoside triphosphate hydrolase protein n=1 Tax=Rhizophagus clarus TaxID=94130 RepID=A0A8H3LC50_9GLOM|nr:P-loop containing nucleoside triphosphate hydrolase protein [Rhizophagus clarus]